MRTKLLIKFYLMLFVLDLIVVAYALGVSWPLWIAAANLIMLFGILIAHRELFQSTDTAGHRILFSRDVFVFVATSVGAGVALRWSMRYGMSCPWWIVAVFLSASFYVLAVPLFGMQRERMDTFSRWKIALGVLLVLLAGGVLDRGLQRTTGKNLKDHYMQALIKREGGLQELVVDEQVRDSQQEAANPNEDEGQELPGTDYQAPSEDGDGIQDNNDAESENEIPIDGKEQDAGRLFGVYTDQAGNLTYGTFLPVLKSVYNLPTPTTPYTFSTISASSELYDAFATARAYTMIGGATSPTSQFRCQNLMVLLGLAEERDLSYTSVTVLDTFWNEASSRGYTAYGCTDPQGFARRSDLP